MNLFRVYRDQLLDVNDATVGSPQTAKIEGETVRCIIGEMTEDEIAIAGGDVNQGGFRLECIPIESLSPEPEKGDSVEARGKKLDLLTFSTFNDATITVQAGSLLRGE